MSTAADTINAASAGISQAAAGLQSAAQPVADAVNGMTGIVQQCAQDANNQISAANAQV